MIQPIRMNHVIVSTYSTNVPWSRDKSQLSIHIMWKIPQSRDIKSRKLKTIKYSICDMSHTHSHVAIFTRHTCSHVLEHCQMLAFAFANSIDAISFQYESIFFWLKYTVKVKGLVQTCSHAFSERRRYSEPWTELSVQFVSQMLYFIASNFLLWTSRDCGILHMMWTDSRD